MNEDQKILINNASYKDYLISKIQYAKIAIYLVLAVLAILGLVHACSTTPTWNAKVFHIAWDKNWYPLQLQDKVRNMSAFSNELVLAIAREEHFQIELQATNSADLIPNLEIGLYDAILTSISPSPNNRERYLFSDPFYLLGPVLITRSSEAVTSLEGMGGKIIGIQAGSSIVFNIQQFPDITIKSYDNILNSLQDLEKMNIDGVILDGLTAYTYTSGIFTGKLKIASLPLTNVGIRLITKNNHESDELIQHFNEGLKKVHGNGIYDKLIQKWGLFNPELHQSSNVKP